MAPKSEPSEKANFPALTQNHEETEKWLGLTESTASTQQSFRDALRNPLKRPIDVPGPFDKLLTVTGAAADHFDLALIRRPNVARLIQDCAVENEVSYEYE